MIDSFKLRKTYSLQVFGNLCNSTHDCFFLYLVHFVTLHMIGSFKLGKIKGFPVFGNFCNNTCDWFSLI